MTRRRRVTVASLALAVVILGGALTGCSGAPVPLEQTTAQRLQDGVLDVTNTAAGRNFTGAQAQLTAVEDDLRTAAASGQVTPERSAKIQSAISLVSADLDAAIVASKPTPTPTPTKTKKPTEEPTEEATEEPTDEPTVEPTEEQTNRPWRECRKNKDCNDRDDN